MDPLSIILILTTASTLIIQVLKLVKRSRCSCFEIETRESNSPKNDVKTEVQKALAFYNDLNKKPDKQ